MMIRIRSKKAGFRRCGIAHSDQWTDYPDATFTPEQLAILKSEPMLQVLVEGEDLAMGEKSGMTSISKEALDALYRQNMELQDKVQQLSDRVLQAVAERDEACQTVAANAIEIGALKAEIEKLKADLPPGPADQPKTKNRRETA